MSAQPEALRLACEYADAVAAHRLESLYGASKEYTLEKAIERDEAYEALAAELRRLHAENEANERNLCQLTDELAKTVTLLRQALELLEDNREDVARVETTYMHKCYDPVLHAIKRHLENGS